MASTPIRWGRWLPAAAVLYTAYTIAFTWPLVLELGDHLRATSFIGRLDLDLHLWTLAWISHAVIADPLHVFDANIFHPAPLALAGSDHLLGTLPVAGPVYWLTGNPVATLNAVVLASFPLAGLAAFALIAQMTGNAWAGLLGGFVYAFLPWRTGSFVPVQTFTVHYLPLALLAIHAYLRHGGRWVLAGGLVCLALQLLTAYYLAYVALVAVGMLLAVAAVRERSRCPARRWLTLGAGLVLVAGAVTAVSIPYLVRRQAGVIPSYGGAVGTAFLTDWLVRGFISRGAPVYLGLIPLALALLACLPGRRRGREVGPSVLLFLSIALIGYALCLGSHVEIGGVRIPLPYSWLAAVVPGFSSMRAALRFITLVALGVGGLAGLGVVRAQRWSGGGARGCAVACVVMALAMWEYRPVRWPMRLEPYETATAVPEVYRWLATHGEGGPVLELPLGPPDDLSSSYRESQAMYFSTFHWLPLLNGYTAYPPPTHGLLMDFARRLPDHESLQALVNLVDVRWVVLHLKGLGPRDVLAWHTAPGLRRAAGFAGTELFEIVETPRADWRRQLLAPPPGQTFAGTPTTVLPLEARSGQIEVVEIPGRLTARSSRPAVVRVTNLGAATWPGMALAEDGLVVVEARWTRTDGPTPVRRRSRSFTRLPRDVPPGQSVTLPVPLRPPSAGRYDLTLRLVQTPDDPFPPSTAPPLVRSIDVTGARAGSRRARGTR